MRCIFGGLGLFHRTPSAITLGSHPRRYGANPAQGTTRRRSTTARRRNKFSRYVRTKPERVTLRSTRELNRSGVPNGRLLSAAPTEGEQPRVPSGWVHHCLNRPCAGPCRPFLNCEPPYGDACRNQSNSEKTPRQRSPQPCRETPRERSYG